MRPLRHMAAGTGALLLLLAGGACNLTGNSRPVQLFIAELSAPATIAAGEALEVTVMVTVGGCRSFDRLEAKRASGRLELVARGRDESGPGVMCPANIAVESHVYRAEPPFTDPFTIVARQPDDTTLEREVRVE